MTAHVRFNELLPGQEVELRKRDPNVLKGDKKNDENHFLRSKKPRIRNNSPHFAAVTRT
jgi:hypothetical protein